MNDKAYGYDSQKYDRDIFNKYKYFVNNDHCKQINPIDSLSQKFWNIPFINLYDTSVIYKKNKKYNIEQMERIVNSLDFFKDFDLNDIKKLSVLKQIFIKTQIIPIYY
jgi:hypothetical protein